MRTWMIATICLGTVASVFGVSPAAPDDAVSAEQDFSSLRRELMWERIESIEEPAGPPQTATLDDLMHQLRSLEIPQKFTVQGPKEPSPALNPVPETTVMGPPLPEQMPVAEVNEEVTRTDELVDTLKKLDTVVSPLQLADVLYCQGHYEAAFENYCTAVERLSEDRVTDRQWILFQKANCCRYSDPDKAIGFYNVLIQSFPNSKWTASANTQRTIIEWNQQTPALAQNKTDDN